VRVALYARASAGSETKPEVQIRELESRCESTQYKIAGRFIDDAHSGRDIDRPAYKEMMTSIDDWDVLLVTSMDRIHRNYENFKEMMEMFEEKGKQFCSLRESFDSRTAMGRFVMDMVQRIAQLEGEAKNEKDAAASVLDLLIKIPMKGVEGLRSREKDSIFCCQDLRVSKFIEGEGIYQNRYGQNFFIVIQIDEDWKETEYYAEIEMCISGSILDIIVIKNEPNGIDIQKVRQAVINMCQEKWAKIKPQLDNIERRGYHNVKRAIEEILDSI
jgi:hypothetical protein